jgi:hypothetical protein
MTSRSERPTRRGLLIPFGLLIAVVVLHGAYWFVASGQIKTRAVDWIATQEAAGYQIEHEGLSVSGYPFRFSLRVEAARIAAPAAEGDWRASVPQVAATAQFYNLNHWIVTPDGPIVLEAQTEGGPARWRLTSQSARLSLAASGGATTRIGASVDDLVLEVEAGPRPALEAVDSLALSGFLDRDDTLALRIQADGLRLAADVLDAPLEAAFGRELQVIRMDAALSEFAALARSGDPAEWRRAQGVLQINRTQLIWGVIDLAGSGDLALDDDLLPAGRLSMVVNDPETLITALVEAGLVHDEQGDALRLAALMAPRREGGVALPLRLQGGAVFLGPARLSSVATPGVRED